MDFATIINRLLFTVSSFNCLLAVSFLMIAIIYRRHCFNFATLLVCNSILIIFLISSVNIAIAAYMTIWDQQTILITDYLCPLRAYFFHSLIACIHHSFILLATEKYCKIKKIKIIDSSKYQVFIVLVQWIFDFTYCLPILLTGNMVKLTFDNMCFVSLSNYALVFYIGFSVFIVTDIALVVLYRRLVKYVRQASSRVYGNQQLRMRRDLTMVRRIVMLNALLVFGGIPAFSTVIMNMIRPDLIPHNFMRALLLILNSVLTFLLNFLCWSTPNLREQIIKFFNIIPNFPFTSTSNRVVPTTDRNRF